jgi:hypothetical protein
MMKTTLLLAAGLGAGLVLASAETFAAGPIAPGTISATSAGSAEAMVQKTVVVVHRRAVVHRPVAVHRHVAVVHRPVTVHRRVVR